MTNVPLTALPKPAWHPLSNDAVSNDRNVHQVLRRQACWVVIRKTSAGAPAESATEIARFATLRDGMRFVEAQQAVQRVARGLASLMSASDRQLAITELNERLKMIEEHRANRGTAIGDNPYLDQIEDQTRALIRRASPRSRILARFLPCACHRMRS